MPTYVYKFLETGETVEVQQSFSDDTLTEAVHPRTGATMAVKKVFQPVGVTFKGDGFYKTDSRGSSKAGASSSGESSSSDGGSADTSTSSNRASADGESKKAAETPSKSSTSSAPSSSGPNSAGGSATTTPTPSSG